MGGFAMLALTAIIGPVYAFLAYVGGIALMAMFDVWRSPPDEK